MRMPDGTSFPFWEDATEYRRVYHVAGTHPSASDENAGTAEAPFATIGRAAAVLEPGERAVVHEGVYRETVRPARGGEGPDRMIAYEAAPGEKVWIIGSDVWRPAFRPSEGFRLRGWGAFSPAPAPPDAPAHRGAPGPPVQARCHANIHGPTPVAWGAR